MTFKEQFQSGYYLEESRKSRYIDFFQDFIKTSKTVSNYNNNNEIEKFIHSRVNKAIEILKREDRVVWFLRYMKYVLYMHFLAWDGPIVTWDEDEKSKKYEDVSLPKYVTQYLYKTLGKEIKQLPKGVISSIVIKRGASIFSGELLTSLEHFLSLPIPAITEYQFINQEAAEVTEHFKTLEELWIEEGGDREVNITQELNNGDIKQLIVFNNGKLGWFDLKRAWCKKEGQTMGHCGNSPRSGTNDTILSFRTIKKNKQYTTTVSHLTFILNEQGGLTESKGQGNSKPATKYHPYIIALLLLKDPKDNSSYLIKRIEGGGYKEENNFMLTDLSTQDYNKIIKERPDLIEKQ